MTTPVGGVCRITYDSPRPVAAGDALRTPSGRTYQVREVRIQKRGRHAGRKHLRLLVVDDAPPGVTVHPLIWYKRGRR